jgi:hypothetical protein
VADEKATAGEEAIGRGYQVWQGGGLTATTTGIVARQGRAVMIYTATEGNYRPGMLTKDARTMAAKVCRLPGVCS